MKMAVLPHEQYRADAETTTTQWRELRNKFIQIEIETDALMEVTETKDGNGRRWQDLRSMTQAICQEAYQQVEWTREILR